MGGKGVDLYTRSTYTRVNMVYGFLKVELTPFLYESLIAEAVVTVLILIPFFRIHGIKTFKSKMPNVIEVLSNST